MLAITVATGVPRDDEEAPPTEPELVAAGHRRQAAKHLRSPAGVAATAATVKASAATEAEALTAQGRRGINRIWEYTQALIALGVVAVTMFIVIRDREIPPGLIAMTVSIVSTYFTRTNHTQVGGVGPPQQQRRGE